jgi:hypothetical protein
MQPAFSRASLKNTKQDNYNNTSMKEFLTLIVSTSPSARNRAMMKSRTMILALALCFAATASCFADNPHMGTWKLNEAKSKIAPGMGKNTTVIYAAEGGQREGDSGRRR